MGRYLVVRLYSMVVTLLGLTVLVPDRRSVQPVTYIVYLNRSRIDVFDGLFGGVARHIVTGKARSTVADRLGRLQRTFAR